MLEMNVKANKEWFSTLKGKAEEAELLLAQFKSKMAEIAKMVEEEGAGSFELEA